MAKSKTVTERLRAAILNGDQTRYEISKATGVSEAVLSRFVHGERSLNGPNIDRLCEYLGLELAPIKRKPTAKPNR